MTLLATPMPLKDVLRSLRERRGLTQMQLAVAAGMSLSGLVQLENGTNTDPRMSTLKALAAALGTSMDALASEDEPGQAAPKRPKGKRKGK